MQARPFRRQRRSTLSISPRISRVRARMASCCSKYQARGRSGGRGHCTWYCCVSFESSRARSASPRVSPPATSCSHHASTLAMWRITTPMPWPLGNGCQITASSATSPNSRRHSRVPSSNIPSRRPSCGSIPSTGLTSLICESIASLLPGVSGYDAEPVSGPSGTHDRTASQASSEARTPRAMSLRSGFSTSAVLAA